MSAVSKRKAIIYGQCIRKKGLTLKTARQIINYEAKHGKLLDVYLCPHCQQWHLTSHRKDGKPLQKYQPIKQFKSAKANKAVL